ncbi:hypothetical protein D3C71_1516630 [compost metagenome]
MLGHGFKQLDAAYEPGLHIVGDERAHAFQSRGGLGANPFALLIVVEDRKARKGKGHNQASCQEDLVAELHRDCHSIGSS